MEEKIWHQHYDYSVEKSYRFPRTPVQDLLGLPSNMYPDKTALYFFGAEITYWELRTMAIRMSVALSGDQPQQP